MISQNENIAFEWSSTDNYNGLPLKEVNLSSCGLEDMPKFINVLPNLEVKKNIFFELINLYSLMDIYTLTDFEIKKEQYNEN